MQTAVLVQENQDLLIKCVTQDLGFSRGNPVAACLIYKCLLQWRSFEVERTTVFDRIIQTIASAIEVGILIYLHRELFICIVLCPSLSEYVVMNMKLALIVFFLLRCELNHHLMLTLRTCNLLKVQDSNDVLAYWLSNTSTLLLLLQHTLKASGAASLTPQRRRTTSASLFGRMSQV